MLLGSLCVRCQAQDALADRMTLRQAVAMARSLGVLRDAHGRRRWATRASAALPCCDPLVSPDEPHATTQAGLRGHTVGDVVAGALDAAAWQCVARERQDGLFGTAHCACADDLVGASGPFVSHAHIEGVVTRVQLGSAAHRSTPCDVSWADARGRRKVVHVVCALRLSQPMLRLWIDVAEEARRCGCAATGAPLAACMQLSRDALLTWMSGRRQQQQRQTVKEETGAAAVSDTADTHGSYENLDACEEGDDEARVERALAAHRTWLQARLLHQRVVVSGQLRMLQLYDEDVHRVVHVPLLWLPADGLSKACRVIAR